MVNKVRKIQSNYWKENKVRLNYESIISADKSTACIFKWMEASISYYEIYKGVKPLTLKLARLKKTAAEKQAKLASTEKLLKELNAELKEL